MWPIAELYLTKFIFLIGPVSQPGLSSLEQCQVSVLTTATGRQKEPMNSPHSPLRTQAADTLRRARKLPPGPHRNDLRQLAFGLLMLDKRSMKANVQIIEPGPPRDLIN
jgi:hypothetical protein